MFNDVLTLIPYSTGRDEIGNSIKTPAPRDILCSVESVTRFERYNYGVADRIPEYTVTVNACEYEGETDCMLRGKRYNIARTYVLDKDLLELTLDKKIGN